MGTPVLQGGTITFSLEPDAVGGQSVKLFYSGGDITDAAGNPLADIDGAGYTVRNEIPVVHLVTFNWDDGTLNGDPVPVSENTPVPLPKVDASNQRAKAGYTHKGWTAPGNDTVLLPESDYPVTAPITFTAVWEPVIYKINYYFVENNHEDNPATYTFEDAIAVSGIPTATSSASDVAITIPAGVLAGPNGSVITWDVDVTGAVNYSISQATGDWSVDYPDWPEDAVVSDPNDPVPTPVYPTNTNTVVNGDGAGGIVTITFLSSGTQYKVANVDTVIAGTYTLAAVGVSFASGFARRIIVDGDYGTTNTRTPAVTITLGGVTISGCYRRFADYPARRRERGARSGGYEHADDGDLELCGSASPR